LLALSVVAVCRAADAAPKPTTIFYHSPSDARPEVLVESKGQWEGKLRGMSPVAGKPGWWQARVAGGASQMVFHHPDRDEWVHPRNGQNFNNAADAREVYIKDHEMTAAFPEAAHVEHVVAPARSGEHRELTVILPPGYDPKSRRKYPVLYLLDGQNLLDSDFHPGGWAAHDAVTSTSLSGAAEPTIVVGIHARAGEGRKDEYAPTRDEAHGFGGGTPKLLKYVTDELVPYIEHRYRTRAGKDSRAIGGSSLGGLATMHALLERPDMFSRGLVFSPAVWVANQAILGDVARAPGIRAKRIVLYHGGPEDDGDQAEQLHQALLGKGMVDGLSLFPVVDPAGRHEEPAWRHNLPYGLSQIFPAR
jgi:predicted alpha/beta superfamily hydrolase